MSGADPKVSRQAMLSAVAYILQAAGLTVADLAAHVGQAPALSLPVAPGEVDMDAVHRRQVAEPGAAWELRA